MTAIRKSVIALCAFALIAFLATLAIARINHVQLLEATDELNGMLETENQLLLRLSETVGNKANALQIPEQAIWVFEDSGQSEAALQQELVNAASQAGLNIISFGAAALPQGVNIPAIAYEIEVEGGHAEAAKFIQSIELREPRLAISYLWARQVAGIDAQFISPVSLRLSVWGFLPSKVDPQ